MPKRLKQPKAPTPAPQEPFPSALSAYMAAIGSKGGKIGGKARLKTMTKAERKATAANAARARWGRKKKAPTVQ